MCIVAKRHKRRSQLNADRWREGQTKEISQRTVRTLQKRQPLTARFSYNHSFTRSLVLEDEIKITKDVDGERGNPLATNSPVNH